MIAVTKPLRILHIVRQYHPAVGGLEAYVRNMVEQQRKLGHKCAVLTLNRVFHGDSRLLPAHEIVDGIPVRRVPFVGKRRFFIPLVSPSFLKRHDIIHVHNTDGFFDLISFFAKILNKPAFATTHGGFFHTSDFLSLKKIYFSLVTRNSGKRYRALFAVSKNDYKIFKGVNGNLVLKPNAIVPPGNFMAAGGDFVYLGRLASHKNIANLIEAVCFLRKKHNYPGKLHIIGPEWDVTQRSLSDLAEKRGIGNAVILHGFLPPEKMESILRRCGFFLSASSFEGFGMSMLEAMAVGLIPFVQPNESFRELVKSGGVGACVDFSDPEKAASSISSHLETITLQDRENARDFARKFSWEILAQDTLESYREYGA